MTEPEALSPGSIPVNPGDVLAGKYRVERVLGIGGMGVVVLATHLQLEQRVAIKFMLQAGLRNAPLVERFAREARAAVRLKSVHVARVLDVGLLDSGAPYMVMEYLEGSDLGSVLETRGALPIDMAVDCVLQACDAVAEAHSLGIVHRDLKPRNLFLTQRNDGRALVKVLDFGISKHKSTTDLSLTRTTEIIGSPNYMSPEQFRSAKAADERSDIWALGVILYELLTGQVPFVADSVTQLTAMVLTEPPRPLQALRTNVPADLVRAVETCMQKDPAARFQSVAQLASALEAFAPPDTRELASRIARIGGASGPRPAASPAATPADGLVANGTSANWAGQTKSASPSRGKRAAIAFLAVIVLAALGAVGVVIALRSRPVATVAPLEPARPVPISAAAAPPPVPVATKALPPTEVLAQVPLPAAAASAPAAPVRPPANAAPLGTAAMRAAHSRVVDAQAPAAADESPRYRTTW
jgi:hypothetical protein